MWLFAGSRQFRGIPSAEYEQHARDLMPLIRQMQAYYTDPGWWDDEEEGEHFEHVFRVGVGSLCRRSPAFILEVITRIHAIIGCDIPLHVWAGKLKLLQAGIVLPGVISCDSGAWNGLFGHEHEKRRASGLTVVEYSWKIKHPAYVRKVAKAQHRPQQLGLTFEDEHHKGPFPDPLSLIEMLTQWY